MVQMVKNVKGNRNMECAQRWRLEEARRNQHAIGFPMVGHLNAAMFSASGMAIGEEVSVVGEARFTSWNAANADGSRFMACPCFETTGNQNNGTPSLDPGDASCPYVQICIPDAVDRLRWGNTMRGRVVDGEGWNRGRRIGDGLPRTRTKVAKMSVGINKSLPHTMLTCMYSIFFRVHPEADIAVEVKLTCVRPTLETSTQHLAILTDV
jgi:hypothetical protein